MHTGLHTRQHFFLPPLSLWHLPRWCRAAHKAIWGVGLKCVCVFTPEKLLTFNFIGNCTECTTYFESCRVNLAPDSYLWPLVSVGVYCTVYVRHGPGAVDWHSWIQPDEGHLLGLPGCYKPAGRWTECSESVHWLFRLLLQSDLHVSCVHHCRRWCRSKTQHSLWVTVKLGNVGSRKALHFYIVLQCDLYHLDNNTWSALAFTAYSDHLIWIKKLALETFNPIK